jgi:hypothetical protein
LNRIFAKLLFRRGLIVVGVALGFAANLPAEDEGVPKGSSDEITFQFLPPPIDDARYSIGVFDAKGKLVRRLQEGALESSFPAALNGLVVRWNAKDDAGRRAPNGHYQIRGYAVGPIKITGVATTGNDWFSDDPALRVMKVDSISAIPPNGFSAVVRTADGRVETINFQDGVLQPRGTANPAPAANAAPMHGWKVDAGRLYQESGDGRILREWRPPSGEAIPVAVAPLESGRFFLLERTANGSWERVRGIEVTGDNAPEWRTFFERNVRVPDKFEAADAGPTLRVDLVKNPLGPRRSGAPTLTLQAMFDAKGSYVGTTDGLRLRQVSAVKGLKAVAMAKGSGKGSLRFFQRDAAASEEFLIEGIDRIMAFDVGGCEINERGEVLPEGEAPDPK